MTTNIWSIKENSDILDFSKFWNVALQTLEENEKKISYNREKIFMNHESWQRIRM